MSQKPISNTNALHVAQSFAMRRVSRWRKPKEAKAPVATPTVAERQSDLREFYAQYENLVDIICAGAQYGPEAKLERAYGELRGWMLQHYSGLRNYVNAYLEPEDPHRGSDAFEKLFHAPTLDAFLRSDDGQMIHRIMHTRQALSLYSEHLRQLAVT